MKTHLLSMLALLAFLVSSCAQDEMLEKKRLSMSSSKDVVFTASFEEDSINSRTYIEEDSETSKLYLRWTKGDEVSIFRGTTLNQRFMFKGETGDNSGSFGYVPNDDFVSSNELDESRNYAFYPYDENNKISEKGELTVTLPAIQKYAEKSFGSEANSMIALTKNTGDVDLKFKNIGGYFKFKLYGDNLTIRSVILQGNNGEKLVGKAIVSNEYGSTPIITMSEEATETLTLDCGEGVKVGTTKETATEFWFVLPPTKFTKGFTIVVTDDNDGIFTKTTEKVFEIKRNIVKPISPIWVETVVDWDAIYAKERAALIDLYKALNGDNWTNNTNWCSDKPVSEWYGIEMESNRVTAIDLNFNELKGKIPETIVNLRYLKYLNLSQNQLSSVIPESIGNLNKLIQLDLSNNSLTGEIPNTIWNLRELKSLNLSINDLSGILEQEIGTLENLKYLNLSGNRLNGQIPVEITNLKSLEELYLSENLFEGEIPKSIGKLCNLKCLYINSNRLTGEIPFSIKNLEKLEFLVMNRNELSGEIPQTICNLTSLQILWMKFNDLTGEIPHSIGNLKNISSIDLSNNKLSGEIPSSIENCQSLSYLNISNNQLSGDVPDCLFFWSNLSLFLDGNFFENLDEYFNQSTDYSMDGEVIVLQTATVGKGVDLIFLGDAFIDKDMGKDGLYEQTMKNAMEELFSIEPYTTLRNRFNVYTVKVVSSSNRIKERARINHNQMTCYNYALKINNLSMVNMRDMMISVIYNPTTDLFPQSFCTWASEDLGFVSFTYLEALIHETGGHGIAKLLDEYSGVGAIFPESEREILDGIWELYGCGANIDWKKDVNTVKWSYFLKDSRYMTENLGIYEGGYAGYKYGVYRPTENSIMNVSDFKYFNAPSREQIYKRIMQLSEGENWTYNYEEFVKFDEKNRSVSSRSVVKPLTEAEKKEYAKKHCPPTFVKGTWRDAMKDNSNIIVPLR